MGNGFKGTSKKAAQISNFNLIGNTSPSTLQVFGIGATSKYGFSNITSNSFNFGGPGYPSNNAPYINLDYQTINGNSVSLPGYLITVKGESIAKTTWNWGDGTISQSGFPGTHTYATPGNYIVTVTAKDTSGLSSSAKRTVTIPY
jgi:PKD repeat protein